MSTTKKMYVVLRNCTLGKTGEIKQLSPEEAKEDLDCLLQVGKLNKVNLPANLETK